MTAPGRFTPLTIQAALTDVRQFDQNFSIKENLIRAIERSPIDAVPAFLQNLIELEAQSGRVLALSDPLNVRASWRVLVRPLGVSFVAETSYVSSVEAAINLSSNEKECYWATHDTKLLIEYLSLVKQCLLSGSLHQLSQQVVERPSDIREAADYCLMKASNESAV